MPLSAGVERGVRSCSGYASFHAVLTAFSAEAAFRLIAYVAIFLLRRAGAVAAVALGLTF